MPGVLELHIIHDAIDRKFDKRDYIGDFISYAGFIKI